MNEEAPRLDTRRRGVRQVQIKSAVEAARSVGLEPSEIVIRPDGELRLVFGGRNETVSKLSASEEIARHFGGKGVSRAAA